MTETKKDVILKRALADQKARRLIQKGEDNKAALQRVLDATRKVAGK